jgi:hypothetical protein
MRFGWFGACWVPDLLEPNSVRLEAQPDSPTLSYYIFYFNFETFFFSSVALLHLQSHLRARRVEVSDDAGEGGASRSRMDPGSTRVAAWLGFIDLAPSLATAKEGTTPRVVVPLQSSRVSTGGASCSGTLWRRSHGSEAHRCNQIIEDSGTSATIAGCSAAAARPQQMKQTTLLRRNISEAGHG